MEHKKGTKIKKTGAVDVGNLIHQITNSKKPVPSALPIKKKKKGKT